MKNALQTFWIRRNLAIGVFLLISLIGALCLTLIPLRFSATSVITLSSKHDEPSQTILHSAEENVIRSREIMNAVIKTWNLTERPEFNPAFDKDRALTTRLMDHLLPTSDNLEQRITAQLNEELNVRFDRNTITFEYSSSSRHIARALANTIAQRYAKINHPKYGKEITEKAQLAKEFSTPSLGYALYCIAIIATLLSILSVFGLKPKTASKNLI